MAATLRASAVHAGATTQNSNPDGSLFTWQDYDSAVFTLDVTAAATLAGDTLNVYVQHSPDGTNWDDVVSFTQVLGNGGTKRFIGTWNRTANPGTAVRAMTDGTLAQTTANQGPVAEGLARVKGVSVGTGSFTYSVSVSGKRSLRA